MMMDEEPGFRNCSQAPNEVLSFVRVALDSVHINRTLTKEHMNVLKCSKETPTGGLHPAVHLLGPSQLLGFCLDQNPG